MPFCKLFIGRPSPCLELKSPAKGRLHSNSDSGPKSGLRGTPTPHLWWWLCLCN